MKLLFLPLAAAIPLITGGVAAIGGAYTAWRNRRAQQKQNEADRAFQEHIYDKQRADNVSDWNNMNRYNSPEQQMQRLREAGLNPNLVYGKGADNTAVMIKGATPGSGNQPAPQYTDSLTPAMTAGLNAMSMYQQVKQTQAQTDNLNKQAALIQADTALREQQTETQKSIKAGQDLQNIKYGKENDLLSLDYKQKLSLADINVESAKLDNKIKEQALELNMSKFELEKINSAADRELKFQQALKVKEEKLILEIQKDIANNTKQEVIEYKKLELKYLQEQLENLKKTGKLLDNQLVDYVLDRQIKQANLEKLKAETEYTKTKDTYHPLEVGSKFIPKGDR